MARASHHWQRPELRETTAGRSSLKATASDGEGLWTIKPKGLLDFLEIWESRVSSASLLEDSCTDLVEDPEQQHESPSLNYGACINNVLMHGEPPSQSNVFVAMCVPLALLI